MKKVLLNLINTDINNRLINTTLIKYLLICLCLLINNCDDPKAPTWESEINFPLLTTSYKFSEILNSEGIQEGVGEDTTLITLEFEDTILDGMGIPPEYFITSGFELTPFNFSISEIIDLIEIPSIIIDETIDFEIPEEITAGVCLDVETFHTDILGTLSFPIPTELLTTTLFNIYDFMTIDEGSIVLSLNDDSFLYPVKIDYIMSSEIGGEDNEIFTNENTSIDSNENIGQEIEFSYTIMPNYNENFSCNLCIDPVNPLNPPFQCNGFQIEEDSAYSISINGEVNISNIYSITGTTYGEDKTQLIELPNLEFDILEGKIDTVTSNDGYDIVNNLEFEITNNSFNSISFEFNLLNFYDEDDENSNLEILANVPTNETDIQETSLAGKSIRYYSDPPLGDGEPYQAIDNIYMQIIIPSQTGEFVLENLYSFNVSNFSIKPIVFEKITTVVHDFIIDVPSLSLSSVPSGIEGVEFVDPILSIELDNMIEINNTLSFNLEALFEDEIVSTLNIQADIDVPDSGSNESVSTKIILDDNTYTVSHDDELYGTYQLESSLVEFLKAQSDELRVSGQASLNGTGSIMPDNVATISGDFELYVPFKMIFGEEIEGEYTDINMIPAQETFLSPIDPSTKESIDNSFIEANLVSSITNHSPFVGVVSILVSTDENFFPLNIDELVNYEEFDLCNPYCSFPDDDPTVLSSIQTILENVDLNIGSSDQIERIEYSPISSTDSRVKHLRFFTEEDNLLLSRLAMLELPYPSLDDEGFVQNAGYSDYISKIDESQISLINYIDSDKPRYMNTLLTLVNSHYPPPDDPTFNDGGMINITVNDSIKISSYSSFLINVGEY